MEWTVVLTGDKNDLDQLSEVCIKPDLTIEKDGSAYILKSTLISTLSTDQDVRKTTEELLIQLNAWSKLVIGINHPIKIAHILQNNSDGTKMAYVESEPVVICVCAHSKIISISAAGKTVVHTTADPIPMLLEISHRDPQVKKKFASISIRILIRGSLFTKFMK